MSTRVVPICTLSAEMLDAFEPSLPLSLIRQIRAIRESYFTKDDKDIYKAWEETQEILKGDVDDYGACVSQMERYVVRALLYEKSIPDGDDFTFYLEASEIDAEVEELLGMSRPDLVREAVSGQGWAVDVTQNVPGGQAREPDASRLILNVSRLPERFSYDCDLWLWNPVSGGGQAVRGRVLACRCQKNSRWSITFRKKEEFPGREQSKKFLNKIPEICSPISKVIFGQPISEKRGLVIVAGRTGSCKSQIAKQLIETYLKDILPVAARRPHLLTFEDPIEAAFKPLPGVDYTQREKGKDAADLREAIGNALRQTPAVMFVGETRDPEEWKLLLEFAGTGHLVVTTAHAGSLTEAMGNILQATKADDPAARSVVAERLLALIHLRPEERKINRSILIPALWHRTPEGIKTLMAEGLSSLVPNMPRRLSRAGQEECYPSSIGRRWFGRELLDSATRARRKPPLEKWEREKVVSLACEWDLQGI